MNVRINEDKLQIQAIHESKRHKDVIYYPIDEDSIIINGKIVDNNDSSEDGNNTKGLIISVPSEESLNGSAFNQKQVNTQTTTAVKSIQNSINTIQTQLNNKVDKQEGKGLSQNDFTTQLKNKLTSMNVVDDLDSTSSTNVLSANQGRILNEKVDSKVDAIKGKGLSTNDYTDEDKSKLDTYESRYDELTTSVTEAISESIIATQNATQAANNAESAAQQAMSAATGVEEQISRARTATTNANTAATQATNAAQAANTATQNANSAAQSAITATTNANTATANANNATAGANNAAQNANSKAELAEINAATAQRAANLAYQRAEEAKVKIVEIKEVIEEAEQTIEQITEQAEQDHTTAVSDHTTAQSDHTTAQSDHTIASSDHTTAQSDHDTALLDHAQAESDHSRAESDHSTAQSDHTTASSDHTRAESDHDAAQNAISSATSAATLANTKAELANTAASNASAKAELANTAATNAQTQADAAQTAATNASTQATAAQTAASNADAKATLAQTAAENANDAAEEAMEAASTVINIVKGYYYNGSFYEEASHTTLITPSTSKIYVDLTDGKNAAYMVDKVATIQEGKAFNNSGSIVDNVNAFINEDYIPVSQGDSIEWYYGTNGIGTLIFYREDKSFEDYWGSSGTGGTRTVTAMPNTRYIRATFALSILEDAYIKVNGVTVWTHLTAEYIPVTSDKLNNNAVMNILKAGDGIVLNQDLPDGYERLEYIEYWYSMDRYWYKIC